MIRSALEPLDAEKEKIGIKSLQYKELTSVNHSVRPFICFDIEIILNNFIPGINYSFVEQCYQSIQKIQMSANEEISDGIGGRRILL